ncbi:hypothetical protein HBH46_117720 [Parastagonospora nodorum]|nr:hypothetical protein HBH46_117720 [Parastagonospora nodorum]
MYLFYTTSRIQCQTLSNSTAHCHIVQVRVNLNSAAVYVDKTQSTLTLYQRTSSIANLYPSLLTKRRCFLNIAHRLYCYTV